MTRNPLREISAFDLVEHDCASCTKLFECGIFKLFTLFRFYRKREGVGETVLPCVPRRLIFRAGTDSGTAAFAANATFLFYYCYYLGAATSSVHYY